MVQAAESPNSNVRTTFRCSSCFPSFYQYAGGMRPSHKRMPTKLCVMVEAGTDHPGVPANVNPVELLTKLLHYVVSLHSTLTFFQNGLRNLHRHAAKEQFCNQLHSSVLYFTVAI